MQKVTTFKKEKVLFESENKIHKIVIVDNGYKTFPVIVSESKTINNIDYPIIYNNQKVGYDKPEVIPKYVQNEFNSLIPDILNYKNGLATI